MGRFSGLGAIKVNSGSVYFLQGTYKVAVTKVKHFVERKKEAYIVECKVLESDGADRPPGCEVSHYINMATDYPDMAMRDIKHFIGAWMEIEDPDDFAPDEGTVDEFWESAIEASLADDQPASGAIFKVVAIPKTEGKPFLKLTFTACENKD